ncbi:hypothetical protein L0V05_01110 [Tabrizicola sp. J26]|uniref:hypothetical protein n=1 Tax=Alitabrizicola rongguiensis TaxID=2909234 RepID=UPI001F2AC096|nr:hypothetical protein [Tabrizicola rongguiensis]MCF1707405.1 hypothetical protein [Tabrizicola rongguiensis]
MQQVVTLSAFAKIASLDKKSIIEKVEYLTFYLTRDAEVHECDLSQIVDAFSKLHYPNLNLSRLRLQVRNSRRFLSAANGKIKLHANSVAGLWAEFPQLRIKSEDLHFSAELIPREAYKNTPSYTSRLADQINTCYERNVFDGCAVLMRRLLEIMLILSLEKIGQGSAIKSQDGTYKQLEAIVAEAKVSGALGLSRNSKNRLDDYRNLGNFAAHKIEFITRRGDIEKVALEFRATIEELISKAGYQI